MIILDATTKSLQIKLSAAITMNQLPFFASYVDSTGTATTPGEQDGLSNNITAVNLVSSPAAATQRLVKNITLQNADTAAATVTIIYNNNATLRNVIIVTLAVGDQLIYEDGNGWSALDKNGNLKTSGSGGGSISSVSNSDGTLTISPTTGAVVASLASLASSKFLVGNGSNIAAGVSMSGDATLANTGAITVTKTSGVAFTSYATAARGQLPGTTTNDNATAGNIGEYVSSSLAPGSAVSLTTNVTANITSISLTAGDWDVWGNVGFVAAGTTTANQYGAYISTTSATIPPEPNGGAFSVLQGTFSGGVAQQTIPAGYTRISLAATTTVYLEAYATFSVSTMSAYGFIGARRAR